MMDIQAAIGLHPVPHLDEFNAKRRVLAERYQTLLNDWNEFALPQSVAYQHKRIGIIYSTDQS